MTVNEWAEFFDVFPLKPGEKTPATPNGFKDASRDTSPWDLNRSLGIGLPTGPSQGFFVVDVDDMDKAKELLDKLPLTYTVKTPSGGRHLYFSYPEGVDIKSRVKTLPGADVRGIGGYVVAPPTPGYESMNTEPFADPPQWLIDALKDTPKPIVKPSTQSDVVEGGRNAYLTEHAGRMVRGGLHPEAVLTALHTENMERCNPPLDDKEVERIARSVTRYEPGAPVERTRPKSYTKVLDLLNPMWAHLSDKELVKGTPTGFEGLDKMLGGGMRLGEVTVLHAEAKTGKNTFWHHIMFNWLEKGIPIAYASRELTPETEVLPNLLSIAIEKNMYKTELSQDTVQRCIDHVSRWPLYFAGEGESGYGTFALQEMTDWVIDMAEMGVQHFFMDHLHYMLHNPEDYSEASKLMKQLKTLCKQRQICLNLIVQPNKLIEGQQLGLNSIKGGAAIGQALDNLITMVRVKDENGRKTSVAKLTLEAARHKLAAPGHIYLDYDPTTMRFTEGEWQEEAPRERQEYYREDMSDNISSRRIL